MACNSEMTDDPTQRGNGWIELNFTIPETRTSLDDSGAGTFSDGDKVGLYIDNGSSIAYRELTYSAGAWQPQLRRSDFGSGNLTLAAHYPVQSGADNVETARSLDLSLEADQTAAGYAAADLLFARRELPEGSSRAEMAFTHALHRLRVEFSGGKEILDPKLRSRMNARVNLLSGEVTPVEESFGWISPRKNSDGSYDAVILPQRAEAFRDDEGLLKFSADGREIVYKAPESMDGTPLTEFQAGRQLTLKLAVKEAEEPVESEWANKKVWVYGINTPEEGAWKKFFSDSYNLELAWKAEYGWYDCNKTNPTGGEPDGMMCWAATASNMLHWWFARNKSYIDRYGDKYKGPDPTYPQPKKQESDIFQCFIDAFENKAGYGDDGLNWFIHGKIPTAINRDEPYNDGGYFKEVFPQGVLLGENIGGLGKERFNTTIKDALANKKAIGVSVGNVRTGHIVTIWGAEFDKNGDVSALYMADNNDRDTYNFFGIGCTCYQVVYEKNPEGSTYTSYMTGSVVLNTPVTINRLFTLSLGEEYWKAYFGE